MSFQWEYYIELAEKLEQESTAFADPEACQRSAISRAYYGAFGLAREIAAREGVGLSFRADDHRILKQHFRQSTHKTRRQIGLSLDRLRRLRNIADYDLSFPKLAKEVKKALLKAREIEQQLQNI